MSPTMRAASGRSTRSSTRMSSSRMATRVSSLVVLIRISRFIAPPPLPWRAVSRAPGLNIFLYESLSFASRRLSMKFFVAKESDDEAADLARDLYDLADLGAEHHPL